jgi:hypothetical protein
MKRLLSAAAVLACCAGRSFAQAGHGFEAVAGGAAVVAERAVQFEGRTAYATGLLSGGELSLSLAPFMVRARVVAGELKASGDSAGIAAATLGDADLRLLLRLTGALRLEGGYDRRTVQGHLATKVWNAFRVGGRLDLPAGDTPLYFVLAGAYYPRVWMAGAGTSGTGIDFESAVRWYPSRFPMWLSLGYRFERRELSGPTTTLWERLTGVVIGGGLALHGAASSR